MQCYPRLKCHFPCFKPSVLRHYADKLTNTKTKIEHTKDKIQLHYQQSNTKCITIFSCSRGVPSDIYLQVVELNQSTE